MKNQTNENKFELLDYQVYAQNPENYPLPILKKFENKTKKLWYFGVNHSYDYKDKMFAQIEMAFAELSPDLVILEASLKINSLTENYKKETLDKTKKQIITEKGEFGLGLWLAFGDSKMVFCPEPSFLEQVEFLQKKFKKDEIFCSFILEMADQYTRLVDEKRTLQRYLEEEIIWQKNSLEKLDGWENFDFSYLHFLSSFQEISNFNFDKTKPDLWSELVDPIVWKTKKHKWNALNEISLENCNFRDRYILGQIAKKIEIHNKILVIYGGSHFYIQEFALKKIINQKTKLN